MVCVSRICGRYSVLCYPTAMTVKEAVRALREQRRETQQVFATRLGMSISTLQNYEQDRMPETKQLFVLEREAVNANRLDLATVFRAALVEKLGPMPHMPRDDFERLAIEVVLFGIRGTNHKSEAPRVVACIFAALIDSNPDRAVWFRDEAIRRGLIKAISKTRRQGK
jgi:transcriptional regulator with XRE-family HTH domain